MDENELMQLLLAKMLSGSQTTQEDSGEMPKLITMLQEANIPFETFSNPFSGKQLCYYGKKGRPIPEEGVINGSGIGSVCSVIYGYGKEKGLLEICGLMTEEEYEKVNDSVLGYLTAEDVFARIKKHWEEEE
ncbi:MAG: hypothetical protein K5920_04755 [Bacteroidales bacterium]|nr:hypothetical protein [Bacteroidales bacterium]